jgi:hypothetical protein
MLDDFKPRGRGEQRAAGREIEAARTVAARADDVDIGPAGRELRAQGEFAHRKREAADLGGGLALDPKRREQRSRERGRNLAGRERAQELRGLVLTDVGARDQALEQRARHRRPPFSRRKLPSSFGPSGVSTLSG